MCQDQKENPAISVPMADSAIGLQGIAVHAKMKANNDNPHHEDLGYEPEETLKESLLPTQACGNHSLPISDLTALPQR